MSKLIGLFNELPMPKEGTEFSAVPARKDCIHKIGKNINGYPVLLISVKKSDSQILMPNVNLRNIKVLYDLQCRISHKNSIENGKFTIVIFTGSDKSLYDSFLRFCEILLDSLKDNPDRNSVAKILDRCVQLFKDISNPPTKTVQGLWAELLFITLVKEKIKMVESWHVNPRDRWDFNLEKIRYEIKSSSNRLRQHFFSQEQLRKVNNTELIVVSIFAEESANGKSIEDLIEDLKNSLKGRQDLIEKVYTLCYRTLGNSLDDSFKLKFDTKLALSSIKAYHLSSIPKIADETIPPQITELKYKIDLEGTESDEEIIKKLKWK